MTDSSHHHQDDPHTLQHHPRPPDYGPLSSTTNPKWPRPIQSSIPHSQPHPPPSLPSLSKVLNPSPTPFMSTVGGSSSYPGRSFSGSIEPQARVSELLARLDLSEYYKVLIEEGFDRIETLMDIQEEDLIALSVKRGHRRRLQRELAWLRGVPHSTPLNVFTTNLAPDELDEAPKAPQPAPLPPPPVQQINKNVFHLSSGSRQTPTSVSGTQVNPVPAFSSRLGAPTKTAADSPKSDSRLTAASQTPTAAGSPVPGSTNTSNSAGTKRRYRRHPKPDPNAPVKPVSAFVTFSSNLRNEESLKDKSFAEMSVLVGERWQALPKAVKEALEARASEAKETYASDMAAYKSTKECQDYEDYLREFRLKNGHPDDPIPSASTSHSRSTSVDTITPRPTSTQRPNVDSPGARIKRERSEDGIAGLVQPELVRPAEEGRGQESGEPGWEEQAAAARVLARAKAPGGA